MSEHTHYHKASKTWFSVEECATCGRKVQAANAVGLHNPESVPGLIYVETLPPEQIALDDGSYGCELCDGKNPLLKGAPVVVNMGGIHFEGTVADPEYVDNGDGKRLRVVCPDGDVRAYDLKRVTLGTF